VHRLLTVERRRETEAVLEYQRRARRDEGCGLGEKDRGIFAVGLESLEADLGRGPWSALEVGARSCWPSVELLRRGHLAAAVGVDLEPLDAPASKSLPRAEAELESIPLEPCLFDLVVAHEALHYAPRPVRALLEMRRVTRRGGALMVFGSPVYPSRAEGEARVARRMKERSERYRFAVPREAEPGYLVRGELSEMFRSAGWNLRTPAWPSWIADRLRELRSLLLAGGGEERTPVLVATRDG
jgi:SAM-dependent methyltransferase